MSNRVAIDLIYVHETEHALLLKDEEDASSQWISKYHCDYDDSYLVPGMTGTFEIDEGAAIEAGFV